MQCPDVLIVEDNAEIAVLESMIVGMIGARVEVASDGASALAVLAERRVDLVILDLNLPRLSGQAVLDRLAQHPANRATPVIVVSATPDQLRPTQQVTAVLGKPFDVRDLREAIQEVLTGARAAASF